VTETGGQVDPSVMNRVDEFSRQGGTPLLAADGAKVLGVIQLKNIVKGGNKDRFEQLRKMRVKTIMITGDNPLTGSAYQPRSRSSSDRPRRRLARRRRG